MNLIGLWTELTQAHEKAAKRSGGSPLGYLENLANQAAAALGFKEGSAKLAPGDGNVLSPGKGGTGKSDAGKSDAGKTDAGKTDTSGDPAPDLASSAAWPQMTTVALSPVTKDGQVIQSYPAGTALKASKGGSVYNVVFYNIQNGWKPALGQMPLSAFEAAQRGGDPTSSGDKGKADKSAKTSVDPVQAALKVINWYADQISKLIGGPKKPESGSSAPQNDDKKSGGSETTTSGGGVSQAAAQLASDYNAVPVKSKDRASDFTIKTPYHNSSWGTDGGGNVNSGVLGTVSSKYATIKAGLTNPAASAPYNLPSAVDEIGRAFWGKATPAGMQLVSQVAVDAGLAGGTKTGVEAWIANGRTNKVGTKWPNIGVDCSGLAYVFAERQGTLTSDFKAGNSGVFQFNALDAGKQGQKNYNPTTPEAAKPGDAIVWVNGGHVVVVSDVNKGYAVSRQGAGGGTKNIVEIKTIQSTGAGGIKTNQRFFWSSLAGKIGTVTNTTGNPYPMANTFSAKTPEWIPQGSPASYAGGTSWVSDYVLHCTGDPAGTNLRDETGKMLSDIVPNFVPIQVRAVKGKLVEVKYGSLTGWASLGNLRKLSAGYDLTAAEGVQKFLVSTPKKAPKDEKKGKSAADDTETDDIHSGA